MCSKGSPTIEWFLERLFALTDRAQCMHVHAELVAVKGKKHG